MKKLVLLVGILLTYLSCLSQTLGSVQGSVRDATTREELPGANVYLANTSIGVATNNDGVFLLDNIPAGKYDLIVSMIGYKSYSKTMLIDSSAVTELKIYLQQEVKLLNEVVVSAKNTPKSGYFKFEKIFLGQTKNSAKCKIVNRQDIFTYEKNGVLIAEANRPIEIINESLGYRIFYRLKQFVYDGASHNVYFQGDARFENLHPKKIKHEIKWRRERDKAYHGSMEHFVRALKKRQLTKNGFRLYNLERQEVPEEKLFVNDKDPVIKYKGKLVLVYTGELAEGTYDPQHRIQESVLNFSGNNVTLYDNGVYDKFQDILLEGYMAWSSRVAEIVPLGYRPKGK
ncbi:MAG: carboxypeptidase-like regulatory domain-containing protein [Bacteroidetes bacterium]|nr:carboxypeptidase-like regulatory domain-containing protein [Bacteroidota bacterium]